MAAVTAVPTLRHPISGPAPVAADQTFVLIPTRCTHVLLLPVEPVEPLMELRRALSAVVTVAVHREHKVPQAATMAVWVAPEHRLPVELQPHILRTMVLQEPSV